MTLWRYTISICYMLVFTFSISSSSHSIEDHHDTLQGHQVYDNPIETIDIDVASSYASYHPVAKPHLDAFNRHIDPISIQINNFQEPSEWEEQKNTKDWPTLRNCKESFSHGHRLPGADGRLSVTLFSYAVGNIRLRDLMRYEEASLVSPVPGRPICHSERGGTLFNTLNPFIDMDFSSSTHLHSLPERMMLELLEFETGMSFTAIGDRLWGLLTKRGTLPQYTFVQSWIIQHLAGTYWRALGHTELALTCFILSFNNAEEKERGIPLLSLANLAYSGGFLDDAEMLAEWACELPYSLNSAVSWFTLSIILAHKHVEASATASAEEGPFLDEAENAIEMALSISPRFQLAVDHMKAIRCYRRSFNGRRKIFRIIDKDVRDFSSAFSSSSVSSPHIAHSLHDGLRQHDDSAGNLDIFIAKQHYSWRESELKELELRYEKGGSKNGRLLEIVKAERAILKKARDVGLALEEAAIDERKRIITRASFLPNELPLNGDAADGLPGHTHFLFGNERFVLTWIGVMPPVDDGRPPTRTHGSPIDAPPNQMGLPVDTRFVVPWEAISHGPWLGPSLPSNETLSPVPMPSEWRIGHLRSIEARARMKEEHYRRAYVVRFNSNWTLPWPSSTFSEDMIDILVSSGRGKDRSNLRRICQDRGDVIYPRPWLRLNLPISNDGWLPLLPPPTDSSNRLSVEYLRLAALRAAEGGVGLHGVVGGRASPLPIPLSYTHIERYPFDSQLSTDSAMAARPSCPPLGANVVEKLASLRIDELVRSGHALPSHIPEIGLFFNLQDAVRSAAQLNTSPPLEQISRLLTSWIHIVSAYNFNDGDNEDTMVQQTWTTYHLSSLYWRVEGNTTEAYSCGVAALSIAQVYTIGTPSTLVSLAGLSIHSGFVKDALELLMMALEKSRPWETVEVLLATGILQFELGRHNHAVFLFRQAVEQKQHDSIVDLALSLLLHMDCSRHYNRLSHYDTWRTAKLQLPSGNSSTYFVNEITGSTAWQVPEGVYRNNKHHKFEESYYIDNAAFAYYDYPQTPSRKSGPPKK